LAFFFAEAPDVVATWKEIKQEAKLLRVHVLARDEDARSRSQKLVALVAGLGNSLQFVMVTRDTRQKGPFLNTAKGDVPSTFSSFGVYTALSVFD
jgi:hydrogenase maturation factor